MDKRQPDLRRSQKRSKSQHFCGFRMITEY